MLPHITWCRQEHHVHGSTDVGLGGGSAPALVGVYVCWGLGSVEGRCSFASCYSSPSGHPHPRDQSSPTRLSTEGEADSWLGLTVRGG